MENTPSYGNVKKKGIKNFIPEHLAYDESMVKHFGPHCYKLLISGKQIGFGYKIQCLNTRYACLVSF